MLFVKKLPLASFSLLLFSYGVFGWLIASDAQRNNLKTLSDLSSLLWLYGVIILLLALSLAAPFKVIQKLYTGWLKSDTRAFFAVIFGAFLAVIILYWIGIFAHIFVLLSAGALVRLDLQTTGYGKWQSFAILVAVSLIGFGLGVILKFNLEPVAESSLLFPLVS
jgi:apolipoprotein N-acyltransferase